MGRFGSTQRLNRVLARPWRPTLRILSYFFGSARKAGVAWCSPHRPCACSNTANRYLVTATAVLTKYCPRSVWESYVPVTPEHRPSLTVFRVGPERQAPRKPCPVHLHCAITATTEASATVPGRGSFLRTRWDPVHNDGVSHVRCVTRARPPALRATGGTSRRRLSMRRGLSLALVAAALSCALVGCEKPAATLAPDAGARPMDGMEKRAAGRAASESAREAMQKRDLRSLRMIRTYVLKRADEPLLPKEDLLLIDLGIQCLELGPAGSKAARGLLARVKDTKLARATRQACLL